MALTFGSFLPRCMVCQCFLVTRLLRNTLFRSSLTSFMLNCVVPAMSGKYIIAGLAASAAIAYAADVIVAQKKVFGGKEWCPISSSYYCKTSVLFSYNLYWMVIRHNTKDGVGQGVVGGDGQEVSGLASHRRAAGGHEPHQPPELHRQGSPALIRLGRSLPCHTATCLNNCPFARLVLLTLLDLKF